MTEINRVLRAAAWRLFVVDLFRRLVVTSTAALVGLLLLRVADAVWAFDFGWSTAFLAAGAGAVVAALAWSVMARARGIAVARELDERADLRESLSTAMCVSGSRDPWAQAVVETARERAKRVLVREAIPIEAPRLLPVPLAAALALVVAWYSLPAEFTWTRAAEAKQAQQQVQQVNAEIKAHRDELAEALKKAGVELKDEDKPEGDGVRPEGKEPEQMLRSEIRRLTSLADQLNALKEGEKGEQLKAAREQMQKLKQPGPGPLDQFSRSLARGNFEKANRDLDELAKKLGDGSLSPEQQAQLQQQLAKMAEQLKQLAEDRQALEKKLEQAGLSKEDAKRAAVDPEALKKALENAKNLTPEQKQQLMEACKAAAKASEACQGMSSALGQMAQGMSKAGMSQGGMEGLEDLAGQLSSLEMLESDLASLDAAMKTAAKQLQAMGECLGECQGGGKGGQLTGLGKTGPWREGDSDGFGSGSGGPGRGDGASPDATVADYDTDPDKAKANRQAGPIIGQSLVYGDQVRGESAAQFSQMVVASEKAATEAIIGKDIPPEYHAPVKAYFGRLKARAAEAQGEAPAAPAAPAGDSQDAR